MADREKIASVFNGYFRRCAEKEANRPFFVGYFAKRRPAFRDGLRPFPLLQQK